MRGVVRIISVLVIVIALGVSIYFYYEIINFGKKERERQDIYNKNIQQMAVLQEKVLSLTNLLKEKEEIIQDIKNRKGQLEGEIENIKLTSQEEKSQLSSKIDSLLKKIKDLEDSLSKKQDEIAQLVKEKTLLVKDLENIKEELRVRRGEILNLEEAYLARRLNKDSLKNVRKKQVEFYLEARTKEREEEISSMNRGYLIKDGKPTLGKDNIVRLKDIIVDK